MGAFQSKFPQTKALELKPPEGTNHHQPTNQPTSRYHPRRKPFREVQLVAQSDFNVASLVLTNQDLANPCPPRSKASYGRSNTGLDGFVPDGRKPECQINQSDSVHLQRRRWMYDHLSKCWKITDRLASG